MSQWGHIDEDVNNSSGGECKDSIQGSINNGMIESKSGILGKLYNESIWFGSLGDLLTMIREMVREVYKCVG